MGGEAVPQGMRMNVLGDASALGCLPAGMPHGLVGHGSIHTTAVLNTGEEEGYRLHPAPIVTQVVQ